MSTTQVKAPTSLLGFGYARCDITPPVGIYHRMWGAARHDAATGVHRPLQADIVVLEPDEGDPAKRIVRLALDFVGLANEQADRLVEAIAVAADTANDQVLITHSHSHAAGVFAPNRRSLPGGELIDPYLEELREKVSSATKEAVASLAPATISYAEGKCAMAADRDYWDEANGCYATGYNPDEIGEDRLLVGRVRGADGALRLVIVNYACHPTTLAWDNTLISPDFVGALRQVVEDDLQAPCCFYQAPCGELGPRQGFVGDVDVADRNGKQVGHAALAALYSMGPPQRDFVYLGPVVSGATIGTWGWKDQGPERVEETAVFSGGCFSVDLDLIELPPAPALEADLARFNAEQAAADERGDEVGARDAGARAERCRRWLGRVAQLPAGADLSLSLQCAPFWRCGMDHLRRRTL